METLKNTKVGKIVAQNFRTARVFSAYGIDFCCRGGITLEQACQNHQVDVEKIALDLQKEWEIADEFQYEKFNLPELITHIIGVHHKYVKDNMPVLMGYLNKVSSVHGERHPELHDIRQIFSEIANELSAHLQKEEMVLFPYIQAISENPNTPPPMFGHIQNPIQMMQNEHESAGDQLQQIAQLSNNYTPPADACQTYRVAFAMLEAFEKDLHLHIHLENNILFPKAIQVFEKMEFSLA